MCGARPWCRTLWSSPQTCRCSDSHPPLYSDRTHNTDRKEVPLTSSDRPDFKACHWLLIRTSLDHLFFSDSSDQKTCNCPWFKPPKTNRVELHTWKQPTVAPKPCKFLSQFDRQPCKHDGHMIVTFVTESRNKKGSSVNKALPAFLMTMFSS